MFYQANVAILRNLKVRTTVSSGLPITNRAEGRRLPLQDGGKSDRRSWIVLHERLVRELLELTVHWERDVFWEGFRLWKRLEPHRKIATLHSLTFPYRISWIKVSFLDASICRADATVPGAATACIKNQNSSGNAAGQDTNDLKELFSLFPSFQHGVDDTTEIVVCQIVEVGDF